MPIASYTAHPDAARAIIQFSRGAYFQATRRNILNKLFTTFTGPQATLWRTLQTFNATRIVIALVLLVFISISSARGTNAGETVAYLRLCSVYLLGAVAFMLLTTFSRKRFLLQLSTQMAVDILIISSLFLLAGGARSGLAILYLFPLAGGAILAPRLLALFFAAVVTLVLLTDSLLEAWQTFSDASISTAGLYGMAFFAAVLLLNELASRLLKQEQLSEQRGRALRQEQAINQLIIADMGDGVLVVEHDATVVTANPSAANMLGWSDSDEHAHRRLTDLVALAPIAEAFFAWAASADDPSENRVAPVASIPRDSNYPGSRFVTIRLTEEAAVTEPALLRNGTRRDLSAHLKLHFAKVRTAGLKDDRTVIFLQDVTEIEARAQDLKLASMGRLTASIAHEVRNPLSAISYAASLLEEEAPDPVQMRLLRIIEENVGRLNRMIEDILKLSRKAQLDAAPLVLANFFAEVVAEFNATQRLTEGLIDVGDMREFAVRFDPLHLREVIVNLLSNAVRYASGARGSVRLDILAVSTNRIELHIRDDGAPITAEVRAHLFEPFYTTSSKGTGLGLYLARELCLNNDAMLDYEYRHDLFDAKNSGTRDAIGRFVITFSTDAST